MNLPKLAYRNFFRNTRRSIISGISVAIAIASIIFARSYIKGATDNISNNVVKLISGHIRITTKEYERRERLFPISEAIDLTSEFYRTLENEEIVLFSPRIKFGVMLGEEELNIPAVGYAIEPERELNILGLNKRIIKGSYIASREKTTIIGKDLAKRLNVVCGDTLTIITRTAYGSPTGINLLIKGVFSTGIGGIDRSIFYVPLDIGQRLLDLEGRATEIVIIVKNPDRAIEVAREIKSNIDFAVTPFQYNPLLQYLNAFGIVESIIYLIILLVACAAIANTMIMVIFERTKEIGMMKAMGMNNPSIIGLLVMETGIIGTIGSFIGTVLGGILSYWLKHQGIDLSMFSSSASADIPFGPVIYLSPTPLLIVGAFLFGLLVSIIVALLPIRGVTKLEPAQALKTI